MKKLQNINQPNWVNWKAQDANGSWWGFEVEPLQNHQGWYENEVGQYIKLYDDIPNPEWQNTLLKIE
ncbi:MAG: hypothetical protein OQL19_10665 [Gammaproteobacteria bacterium]|nr:hypothetical protein [Gammaproteobacteria bacterium]